MHWSGKPFTARHVVALIMFSLGMGRLGLFAFSTPTTFSPLMYAVLLLTGGVALLATGGRRRGHWCGRIIAALAAGLLAGLAIDAGVLTTSTLNLYILAVVLLVETGMRREC